MLRDITPVILTLDEAPNIARTLAALAWAQRVVVVDSFSTDGTADIARGYPNVALFQRRFDTHAQQWTFAIEETGISTEWVLALDADYVVPQALVDEMAGLAASDEVAGYSTAFVYYALGRPLRGSVYPPVTTLYRRARARYRQDGHTQRIEVRGRVDRLRNPIFHDDRKSLDRWLRSQDRYMAIEARQIAAVPLRSLSLPDRVRRLVVVAPLLMFLYCAFVKGNVLDGRAGLYYAVQRTLAECLLSLRLLEAKSKP